MKVRYLTKALLLSITLLIFAKKINAQNGRVYDKNQNYWLMYNGDHKFAKKWGFHFDGFIRRANGLAEPQQWLVRPGINFHANANTTLSAGYFYVKTFPYGDFPAKSDFFENRLWEQIQLKGTHGIMEWTNRLRLEQRYVHSPVQVGNAYEPGPAVYSNRMRISNRASIPLKGKTIADKAFYVTAFDEVFINFGKNVKLNLFDQNRAFVGLGYKISKTGRIEGGYLNQLNIKSNGLTIENNHTVMLTYNASFDLVKMK